MLEIVGKLFPFWTYLLCEPHRFRALAGGVPLIKNNLCFSPSAHNKNRGEKRKIRTRAGGDGAILYPTCVLLLDYSFQSQNLSCNTIVQWRKRGYPVILQTKITPAKHSLNQHSPAQFFIEHCGVTAPLFLIRPTGRKSISHTLISTFALPDLPPHTVVSFQEQNCGLKDNISTLLLARFAPT